MERAIIVYSEWVLIQRYTLAVCEVLVACSTGKEQFVGPVISDYAAVRGSESE